MNPKRFLALLVIGAAFTLPLQAKHDKQGDLPPGLQKKAQRGQPLPPGWQKKIRVGQHIDRNVFEQEAVVVTPRNRDGLLTVRIDGKLLQVAEKSMEIVNILNH